MSEIKRSQKKAERSKKKSKKMESSSSESETESSSEDELPSGASKISKDDFYNKSGEFMYWLRKKRKLYLEDTPSKEAKRHFKSFVKKWNNGRLNQGYYDGSYVKHTNSSQRTKHHWKFSDKLDNVEMGILRDTVVNWTSKKETKKESTQLQTAQQPTKPKRIIGPSMPPQSTYDKELSYEEKKKKKKYEDKKHRKHKETVLDELLPKATGHEAKVEKRIAAAQQRKEREQSPEYGDGQLMGGGESIRSIMEKRKHKIDTKRTARAEKAKAKINAYEEKEKEKMKELMQLAREAKSQQSMW